MPRIGRQGKIDLDLHGPSILDLTPLRELPLRSLKVASSAISDLGPLTGTAMEVLWAGNCKNLVDLSPLANCVELEKLAIFGTSVTDLGSLKAPKLKRLWLASTPVTDLSPLRELPLLDSVFSKTEVKDIRPLLECKALRQVELSKSVENVVLLRDHAGLTHLPYGFDHRNARLTKLPRSSGRLGMRRKSNALLGSHTMS